MSMLHYHAPCDFKKKKKKEKKSKKKKDTKVTGPQFEQI